MKKFMILHFGFKTPTGKFEFYSETLKKALANSKFKNAAAFGTKIKGHIMITDHTDECWFRNIKLLELPAK